MNISAPTTPYQHHRFPAEIINHGVWLYHRFCLSYRDVSTPSRERRMPGFKLPGQAQRFLSAYGPIASHFRPRHHLFPASEYRQEMTHRFQICRKVRARPWPRKDRARCNPLPRPSDGIGKKKLTTPANELTQSLLTTCKKATRRRPLDIERSLLYSVRLS
jgi:hypothetical protein